MYETAAVDSARLREIISRLCDLEPSARSALLDEVSEGDPQLRAQVEQLLGTSATFCCGSRWIK